MMVTSFRFAQLCTRCPGGDRGDRDVETPSSFGVSLALRLEKVDFRAMKAQKNVKAKMPQPQSEDPKISKMVLLQKCV
jgi:hypothetical protein